MIDAADTVTSKVSLMQDGLDALATNAPRRVAEIILKAMKDAQRAVVEEQARAMAQASKGVVDQAIAPALHGVAAQLRSLGRQQTDNLVLLVSVGAVAGIISSLCTTVLVLRFLVH
ncbi:MAG: hypothetical protein MZW92_29655 [Comamonadaceae bacterium]|nr:hypothetical protein [Comamonadaceae bacterium]